MVAGTTGGPLAAIDPAGDGSAPGSRSTWRRTDQRLLSGLVVALVLTMRFGIPVGDTVVSVAIPLTYAVCAVLLVRRGLQVDRLRGELYLLAVVGCLVVTTVASFQARLFSMTSLLLLLTLYLPWVLRVRGDAGRAVVERTGRTFVRVMLGVGGVGVAQFVAQLTGVWSYTDYLGELVPPDLLILGYNTSIPLVFGSGTFKANGFVLLEPSFLSQYCALAVLIALQLRMRAWVIAVLLAGMVSAISGTGFLLLICGAVLTLVRNPRHIRPSYVVAAVVAAVLLVTTPAGSLLYSRSDEVNTQGSSGNARFVQPYTEVWTGLQAEPDRYGLGAGAGTTERILPSARDGVGDDVLYSIVPKLTFEYGLIAGGLFIVFLLLSMLDRAPWRVVPGALVVMTFALSGGLLQPQTAYLAWVFSGLGTGDRPPDRQGAEPQKSAW